MFNYFQLLAFCFATLEEKKSVHKYFEELYISATQGYQENMLLSPEMWCTQNYLDELINGRIMEFSSSEALKHSYYNMIMTKAYYMYLFQAYTKILVTKKLRNPVEFCMNVPAANIPSNYAGVFIENISNEDINVQNRERNQHAGEGTSQGYYLATDNDGYDIDLNLPPKSV